MLATQTARRAGLTGLLKTARQGIPSLFEQSIAGENEVQKVVARGIIGPKTE